MSPVQILAAQTAIRKMLEGSHFSICTVDAVLEVTKGVPDATDYKTLRLLHCIHYRDMPAELRRELPELLGRVLSAPSLETNELFIAARPDDAKAAGLVRKGWFK